ncbi:MAG: hypothetical protein OXB97_01415 [Rhodospirillales bacterium]|nr:hypothetical protein [Rhodospirillales bacterium]
MSVIRVALLQLSTSTAIGENFRSGLAACREARAKGADIALLPEIWSHGYALPNAAYAELLTEPTTPDFDLEKLIH